MFQSLLIMVAVLLVVVVRAARRKEATSQPVDRVAGSCYWGNTTPSPFRVLELGERSQGISQILFLNRDPLFRHPINIATIKATIVLRFAIYPRFNLAVLCTVTYLTMASR